MDTETILFQLDVCSETGELFLGYYLPCYSICTETIANSCQPCVYKVTPFHPLHRSSSRGGKLLNLQETSCIS